MGRKKRSSEISQQNALQGNSNSNISLQQKKARTNETGESYLVKKYRPTKIYSAMEAFVKYTKSHRMLDASYVRWRTGVTTEKPFVFSTRVGGTDLGWGRGKTRDAAIDCACRAAFSLVAAHGYNNFPIDADCLTDAPVDPLPPPPPPPPPPPIGIGGLPPGFTHPPLPHGLPPLPHGDISRTSVPVPSQAPTADIIPQAKIASNAAPTASSLSTGAVDGLIIFGSMNSSVQSTSVSLSLNTSSGTSLSTAINNNTTKGKKRLKGGLTLVYDAEGDGFDEVSMEEKRASLNRYQKLLSRSFLIA